MITVDIYRLPLPEGLRRRVVRHVQRYANHAETTVTRRTAQPQPVIDVGFTWQSERGECRVVDRKSMGGQDVFLVKIGDSPALTIIPIADIERWVAVDVSHYEARARARQQQAIDAAEAAQRACRTLVV